MHLVTTHKTLVRTAHGTGTVDGSRDGSRRTTANQALVGDDRDTQLTSLLVARETDYERITRR